MSTPRSPENHARDIRRDFDRCPHREQTVDEDLPSALADIQLESTRSIGVVTDILWPAHQQETLSAAFAKNGTESQYIELPSIQGHDAFLLPIPRYRDVFSAYLKRARDGN